eukprot:CAMPEP_0113541102 /NCGR_PEP_ID=MMETSP0015_2-20120614/8847_1 /TAXON_ID=2838 /ORGANISM="Odontella" /LENGTH=143 /DNA_ID=CAMNT_0000440975 /DNA_START=91 /DNA_END=523 /DNA_ORIENTATION=- /assembly_acc=CAM_ASM_000160
MASPRHEWVDVDADSASSGWENLGGRSSSSGCVSADLEWLETAALRELLGAANLRATEAEAKLAEAEAELVRKSDEEEMASAVRVSLDEEVRELRAEVGVLRLRLVDSELHRLDHQQLFPAFGATLAAAASRSGRRGVLSRSN